MADRRSKVKIRAKAAIVAAVSALALVGLASGAGVTKTRNVTRYCVWVEEHGNDVTKYDVKTVKVYKDMHRVCIVGKRGKRGLTGARGAQGSVGPQGANGAAGA